MFLFFWSFHTRNQMWFGWFCVCDAPFWGFCGIHKSSKRRKKKKKLNKEEVIHVHCIWGLNSFEHGVLISRLDERKQWYNKKNSNSPFCHSSETQRYIEKQEKHNREKRLLRHKRHKIILLRMQHEVLNTPNSWTRVTCASDLKARNAQKKKGERKKKPWIFLYSPSNNKFIIVRQRLAFSEPWALGGTWRHDGRRYKRSENAAFSRRPTDWATLRFNWAPRMNKKCTL